MPFSELMLTISRPQITIFLFNMIFSELSLEMALILVLFVQ